MNRIAAALLTFLTVTNAFTSHAPTSFVTQHRTLTLYSTDTDTEEPAVTAAAPAPVNVVERGVSMDQDGKSNVWAIEPKMEIDTKSAEEKTSGVLLAVGGFAAFAAAAGVILTNLPDPNSF